MKKRFVATVLSLMMAFSLTACGNAADDRNVTVDDAEVVEDADASVEEDADAEDADAEDADAEENDEAEADADVNEQNGVFGAVNGDVYTNTYFGIKFEAIDGFSFLGDDVISQLGYMTAEVLGEGASEITEAIESGETVTDCLLADSTFDNSMNVTIGTADAELTQDDAELIIDATLPVLTETYEGMGFENIVCERSTITFMGEETPCINMSFSFDDNGTVYDMSMVEVILVKEGYTATITLQADSEETISALSNGFSAIEE